MHVIPVDPRDRSRVKQFLELPFKIYREITQWVPPLETDARRMLDTRRHPFYRHSEAAFFLAVDGDSRPIGRLAVLHNRPFNDYNRQRTAFFYLFESLEDPRGRAGVVGGGFRLGTRERS